MTDEVIADIEAHFMQQSQDIDNWRDSPHKEAWASQNRDNINGVARVVGKFRPDYGLRRFYTNCGFKPPFPEDV